MATFVHEGKYIDHIPGADVAAGAVVVQGDLVGVAPQAIAANTLGSLTVEGVFDVARVTGVGTGITAGAKVYIIPSGDDAGKATKAADDGGTPATAYILAGKAVVAAGDSAATVRVRLSQ